MDLYRPLFRVQVVLRVVLVLLTCVANVLRADQIRHPLLAVVACAIMVVWSGLSSWLYLVPRYRRSWVFVTDLLITLLMELAGIWVMGPVHGGLSLAGYWIAAAPVAVAIRLGWSGGLVASLIVAVGDRVATRMIGTWSGGNLVVLIAACTAVGYITGQIKQTTSEREQMYAVAAAMGERQRLARVVHDGVLQVLAMVEREGRGLGERGTWLAHRAHEQEVALRALLQDNEIDPSGDPPDQTHANLAALLDRHATTKVTVSAPAGALLVESTRAYEIDAAVSEALTNVARHAGPEARAWVLLEREGDELIVSIRDNGVGAHPRMFEDAVQRGRMGTRLSILGRLQDLGGTATMHTAPGQGVEWEFRVPVGE